MDQGWDPSWSDEEEDSRDSELESHHEQDNDGKPAKYSDDLTASRSGNGGIAQKVPDKLGNVTTPKVKKPPEKIADENLFRRKFYSKEELFKNLTGHHSMEENRNLVEDEKLPENLNNYKNGKNYKTSQLNIEASSVTNNFKTFDVELKSNQLKCRECGKQFEKKIHLTLHEKIHASMDKPLPPNAIEQEQKLVCEKCDRCFERSNQLKFHRNLCKVSPELTKKLVCEKCDRSFGTPNQLKFHRNLCKVSSEQTQKLVCEKCDRSFETTNQLKFHRNLCKISPQQTEKLACEKCDRSFETTNQLKFHRNLCKISLQQTEKLACEKCDRSFGTPNQLKFHRNLCKVVPQQTEKLVCEKCDRSFERTNQLKFHRKLCKATSNSLEKSTLQPIKQDHEDLSAADVSSAVVSFSRTSSNVSAGSLKIFSCTDCDRQFKFQHHLNFHMKSHTKLCKRCSLKFHETEFEEHIKSCSVHSTFVNSTVSVSSVSSSLKCVTCGKAFANQAALRQHDLLHQYSIETFEESDSCYVDSILPFICKQEGCESRFSDEFDLDFHHKKKHNMRSYSNPTYFHIQDAQLPPLNPYVLLTRKIQEPAAIAFKKICTTGGNRQRTTFSENLKPRLIKRRFKSKRRGAKPRDDIPFQDFYICEICDKRFNKRNAFLCHLAVHKREGKFTCPFCERKFLTEALHKAHVDLHSDPSYVPGGRGRFRHDIPIQSVYTCETCQKEFTDRNYYLIHISVHKREEQFTCKICGRKFLTELLYNTHLDLHKDPNYVSRPGRRFRSDIPVQSEYTCEECGEKFQKRNLYLLHLLLEKFKCTLCERKFQSEALLDAHMERHSDPSYDPGERRGGRYRSDIPIQSEYTCEECGEKFQKRNLYLIHLQLEKFKCTLCERKFQSGPLLDAHMERHSDPSYDPGRGGRYRSDIPIQSEYTCEECGEKFQKRNLYLIHLALEKFKCTLCERKFQSGLLLDAHMKRHSDPNYVPGERGRYRFDIPIQSVYTCETCHQTFEDRKLFISHLTKHKREEKLTCHLCQQKFPTKLLFQLHQKRHTDPSFRPRRPRSSIPIQDVYRCEKCDRSYTDRNRYLCHLYYHRNKHTDSYTPGTRKPRRSDIPIQDVYFCEKCDNKEFSDRIKYIMHLNSHDKDGSYKYNMSNSKERRKKRSDIPVQDIYYCEQCDYKKTFTDRNKYIIHLRNHGLEKRHKCDGCLKLFKTTSARDIHRERFCKGIPCKYKCDRCSDRFHNKITLTRHFQRYHSKVLEQTEPEIEYPCNECCQTFNTTFGLTRHQQIYHPVTNITVEVDPPNFADDDNDDYAPHDVDWSPEEDNHMLAASFCEAELTEEPSKPENSLPKAPKRKISHSKGSTLCQCRVNKKYKSQKFCHSLRCPCVQAGNRCSKNCDCDSSCLNSNEMEDKQQQTFREGKESMMEEDAYDNASTPVVFGYSDETMEESYPEVEPEAHTSSLGYNKLIPTSEFITVDDVQDESMRQLSMEGYVEGAEDMDPLADPLEVQHVESIEIEPVKVFKTEMPKVTENRPVQQAPDNHASVSSIPPVEKTPFTTSSASTPTDRKNLAASMDSFNQSANLRCQFCKKNFKIVPTFISHILLHDVEKTYLTCPICSKDLGNQITVYTDHLDGHNKGISLQCTKCSSKFKAYKDMEKHLKVHHFRPMECGICDIKFLNSQLMMAHWSKVHPTCQCGLCNVKFFSYDDLTFHMKSLHSPYDCLRCNDRFENLDGLMNHFMQQHSTKASPQTYNQPGASQKTNFKCSYCDYTCTNGDELNEHLSNHLASHHKQSPVEHQCSQCQATFTTPEDLHDHLAHHIMGTTNKPSVSGQFHSYTHPSSNLTSRCMEFPTPTNKIQVEHVVDDVVNDNMPAVEVLTCPKCGKGFHNRTGWRSHLTTHKLLLCSACDSTFETKEELLNHLQVTSCVVYFCEVCDRNFQAKKYLSQHQKFVHGGEKKSTGTNKTSNEATPTRFVGYFAEQGAETGENVLENSFPVIVASTSLAQNSTRHVSSAANGSGYPTFNRTQSGQREIEEIVLD